MLTAHYTTPGDIDAHGDQRPFWIDLQSPTAAETAQLCTRWGLQVPTRAALEEIESSSRLRSDGPLLYTSMPMIAQESGAQSGFAYEPLGFILSPDTLVTIRYSALHAVDTLQAVVTADPGRMNSATAFATLIDGMVDAGADVLEKLSSELGSVSRHIFSRYNMQQLQAHDLPRAPRFNRVLRTSLVVVGIAGNHLSGIRESLLGLQRIVGFVGEMAAGWMPPDLQTRLKSARGDLASLVDFEVHLSGKIQFLLDAILGFINTEQNDIFKVLTIVSVVGIPPTLIASMYGMNFHYMPELAWRWGYIWGLGLIALSVVLPIVWFKRRGWW